MRQITPYGGDGPTCPSTLIKYLGMYLCILQIYSTNNFDENVLHTKTF